MYQAITGLTSKGQVTVPLHVRRALGLAPRDRVVFEVVDGVATVRKAESVVDRLGGSVAWPGGAIDFRKLRAEFADETARDAASEAGLDED